MANYTVTSGNIREDILYCVNGSQSVIYNTATYVEGQFFRGAAGVRTFSYSGSGMQSVIEVLEFTGGTIEFSLNSIDQPSYPDLTKISGIAIEMTQSDAEKLVNESTVIKGFAMELIDFPFYSFSVLETRL